MNVATPMVPEGVDVSKPNAARMYDYYLGGKHNFAADREAAETVIAASPLVVQMAQSNRAWMGRVVRHLVGELGVRQILDLGSGVPTVGNVHEIAFELAPDSFVTYVDIEPVAIAHARMLLAADPRAMVVQEDICRPNSLLHQTSAHLDFRYPVLVMMSSVLPFVLADPTVAVNAYVRALSPGSFLAISHASSDGIDPELLTKVDQGAQVYSRTETPVTLRSRDEIASWFAGLSLIPPGLVRLECWHPHVEAAALLPMISYGGVGRVGA